MRSCQTLLFPNLSCSLNWYESDLVVFNLAVVCQWIPEYGILNMKHLLTFAFLSFFCWFFTPASLQAVEVMKPNVVLIFIDDMGYGDIEPFGSTKVRTPNLNTFAKEGRKFHSFYATPVCSMSRAALMTGCYNQRISIPGVLFPQAKIGINSSENTVAEVLKSAGYATACIGKWHLGHLPEFLPTRHGFDHYFGLPYSNDMNAKRPGNPPLPLIRGEKTIETEPDQSLLTKRYTEDAIEFMKQNKSNPFFLYLPHTMIHGPMAASEAFKGKSASGLLGDVIEEIDWSVGQVMKTIKELGLDEKTLVIFTSDNGPATGSAGPFRGKKGSNFEGGVREPCIMRWPGKIPAGTQCKQIAGNIDVLPTLASLAGVKLDPKQVIDGRDISSLMMDDKAGPVRDVHLYCTANLANPVQAIRMGDWKLFLPSPNEGGNEKKKKDKGNTPEANMLFNLDKDPGETTNVYDKNPEIVEKLRKEARIRINEILANRRPAGGAVGSK